MRSGRHKFVQVDTHVLIYRLSDPHPKVTWYSSSLDYLTAKALFEGGIQRGAGLTDRCLIEG
jgi:hypothetical protein